MTCRECGARVRPAQHHPITACLKRLQREVAKLRALLMKSAAQEPDK